MEADPGVARLAEVHHLGGAERLRPGLLRDAVAVLVDPEGAGAADVEAEAVADRMALVAADADRGVDVELRHFELQSVRTLCEQPVA